MSSLMQRTGGGRQGVRGGPGITRWDPGRDFEELQMRLGQLMENALGSAISADSVWVPLADIEETEDAWIVEAEVPGVNSDDLNVEVRDSEVVISGEVKERERRGLLRRRARPVGRFEYRVVLPGDVNPENIEASLDNGILTLRVPKAEQARPRRIAIGHGQGASAQGSPSGPGSS